MTKEKNVKIIKRIIFYIIGLFTLAVGNILAIRSGLGVSPVNAIPYVVNVITGMKLGTCTIIVYSFFLLFQILLLKKEFKLINLTQLIFSTIFGYFLEFGKYITKDLSASTHVEKLVLLSISIILVALGVTLYVEANLVKMPAEGVTYAMKEKIFKKLSFPEVKIISDSTLVTISIIISFMFLNTLVGAGIGTIACALLAGKIMKPTLKIISPFMKKICF